MATAEIKTRFASTLLRFVAAIKAESEICMDLCGKLNEKELMIIIFVGERQSVKMSEIADSLQAPLSTLSSVVDKLVEKQYLGRVHSEEDRRVVQVTLVAKGKAAYKTFLHRKNESAEKVLARYSVQEQNAFIDYLDRMTRAVEAMK
jgi:DNA-binding MarR family transcriptional regulator